MRTLYLNNYGSRWVNVDENGKRDSITLETKSGRSITRQVEFWSSFGNFAAARISYKGKSNEVSLSPTTLETLHRKHHG